MNILLTGGTGFIGSYVLMALLEQNHNVTVLARNASKVPAFQKMQNVEVLEIPMTDFEGIKKALKGKDAVIHVALNYNDNSAYDMLTNDTVPTIFLASEAAKAGVKHFIYTSSTAALDSIYSAPNTATIGDSNYHADLETKHQPQSYYGATKAASEDFLLSIAGSTDMRVNIVRPGYTFGNPVVDDSFSQPDSRFKDIAQNATQGKDIEVIKNDGTQFIWAGDLAKIYISLLNSNNNKTVYFGLTNSFTSWEKIAQKTISLANSSSKLVVKDLGWGDKPIMFDVSKYTEDFGLKFSPHPHLEEHISFLVKANK